MTVLYIHEIMDISRNAEKSYSTLNSALLDILHSVENLFVIKMGQYLVWLVNFFFLIFIYVFIYFWLCWVFCASWVSVRGLSLVCGEWGPLFITVHGPLTVAASLVAEHKLQTRRLSSCGSRDQLLRGMWDLPRLGLEPVFPRIGRQILNHCATREAPWLVNIKIGMK